MITAMRQEFFEVNFNFAAVASVVSLSSTSLHVTALFRAYNDFVGLIYFSEDQRMHSQAAYTTGTDYTDVILSFSPSYSGNILHFDSLAIKPSLTITCMDDTEKYVALGFLSNTDSEVDIIEEFTTGTALSHTWIKWESEVVQWEDPIDGTQTATRGVDYVMDYAEGIIYPTEGGSIPYGVELTVSYEYGLQGTYTIPFSDLHTGLSPDYSEAVSSTNIKRLMFPIIPSYYNVSNPTLTGNSDVTSLTLSNFTITGAADPDFASAAAPHPFRFAEGYDDEYYRNPYRLIQAMHHLGYRKILNLYTGASHYYDKKGTAGDDPTDITKMELIAANGVNDATKMWFRYLLKAMDAFSFEDIIVSLAMENLQMPSAWKQLMHNGDPGQTGWDPPTSFFSPTNAAVKNYWQSVAEDFLDIVVDEGFTPTLQLGEPWWWWQEFMPGDIHTPYPGKPPCFYDQATKDLYVAEKSKALPIFTTSEITLNAENLEAIEWLRDKLGAFSDFAKSVVEAYTGGVYGVMFFPPSVLDEERVPEAIRIVNFPSSFWELPKLSFIQIEDYDWLVNNDDKHMLIFDFARGPSLRYQHHLVQYFAGFAWYTYPVPISTQWERIERAAVIALSKGMQEVFIWAGSQIRRDSWSPALPIRYITEVRNKAVVNMKGG